MKQPPTKYMAFCGKRVIYLGAAIELPTHRIASLATNPNHNYHSQATTNLKPPKDTIIKAGHAG